MPDLQSNQTTFRAGNYTFSGWLCTPPETVIFSRAVNMTTIADPLFEIVYDNAYTGTGVFGDVPNDADILLYSGNTSTQKGRIRVAYGGADATTIQINEVSVGRISVANNDRFDVLNAYRLRDKLVGATETFPKDSRREYTDEGEESPPRVIVGGAAIATVAVGAVGTFTFNATASRPTDPDNSGYPSSSSGLTFLYAVGDGTITVGTTTTATITATFPVGFRWITLTVTDAGSGKSTVRKIPVFVFDGTTYSPIPVKRISYTLGKADGGTGTLELMSNCGLSDLPEGAPVWYFEREWYDGTEASYGNMVADRSNIKLHGYLRRESISIDPNTDTLSVEVISPLLKLAEIGGFSQNLKTIAAAANWQEDEQVTLAKLAWYVWHWHTTASVLYDLYIQDADYDFTEFLVQQATLRDQMNEVTAGISKLFTCDRSGRFIIARNLQRGTTTERTAAVTTLALTVRDLREIPDMTWEHAYQVAQVVGKAVTEDGRPLLSVAAGEAPAEAPDITSFERLIVTGDAGYDQVELNAITSNGWAEANSLYNGLPVPKGMKLKPLTTMDVLDPAYPDWLALTLAASTNRRGRSFSADRFVLQSVDIEADGERGTKDLTWTVDHETLGQGAVTRAVPVEVPLPPRTDPGNIPIPTPIVPPFPPYDGVLPTRAVILAADGPYCGLATAFNPATGVITYANRSTGLTGTEYYWGCSNPWLYEQFYALGDAGIESTLNIDTGTAFSVLKNNTALFGGASFAGHKIGSSINRNGFHWAISGANVFTRTLDGWGSVSSVSINGAALAPADASGADNYCDVSPVPRNAGVYYAIAPESGGSNQPALWKTTNYGAVWTLVGALTAVGQYSTIGRMTLEVPYTRQNGSANSDGAGLEIYMHITGLGGVEATAYLTHPSLDFPANQAGTEVGSLDSSHPLTAFTHDGSYAWWMDAENVRFNDDGLATGSSTQYTFSGSTGHNVNGYPSSPNIVAAWSRTAGIAVSLDGVTFFGNVPSFFATAATAYLEYSLYPTQ